MFESTIDYQMILEMNQLLHEKNIHLEVKTYSGCAACGLHLLFDDKKEREKGIQIITDYLYTKWLKPIENPTDDTMLYIESRFKTI